MKKNMPLFWWICNPPALNISICNARKKGLLNCMKTIIFAAET